jgi:predicted permease
MDAGHSRTIRVLVAVYGVLVRAYPARLRHRYGEEMVQVFATRVVDAARLRGMPGLMRFWAGALADVLRGAFLEHVRERWRPSVDVSAMESTERNGRAVFMRGLGSDVRHGVRSLMRAPAFTLAAVLTIGLGIGANVAIFSVINAVLLRPLPYADPDRLVILWQEMTQRNVKNFPLSPPDLRDYQEQSTQLEGLAGIFSFPQPLSGDGEPVVVQSAIVTPNFFSVMGVRPVLGRDFVPSDADVAPAAAPGGAAGPQVNAIVMLSNELWRTRFGGDPTVVGRIIDLGGDPGEVVGVLPPGFELLMPEVAGIPSAIDLWSAARIDFETANRNNAFLRVIGRLAPGATLVSAQAEVDRITADLRARFTIRETAGTIGVLVPMHTDLVASVRTVLLTLMGAVGFVLLIACSNVANLMLVRSAERERELAVRSAIGGSRWRLIRQTLAESALLSLAGGVLGVMLAWLGISALRFLRPEQLPRLTSIELDGAALAFTGLAAACSAVLFGLVPALRASRPAITQTLHQAGRSPGLSANRLFRNAVIVGEVALTLVLMIGAGLMIRTFSSLQRVDHGFDASGVLTFQVGIGGRFPTPEERRTYRSALTERLRSLPGVEAAASGLPVPLDGTQFHGRWGLEEALSNPAAFRQANYRVVSAGFFDVLRTRVLDGRVFTPAEMRDSADVVVVDEQLAAIAFPGRSAVGERILVRISTPEPVWVRIVGVVERQRQESLMAPSRETIYFTDRYAGFEGNLPWFVRTSGDPLALAPAVRQQVSQINSSLPVSNVRALEEYINQAMAPTRFALSLISTFATLALILAVIGLYGVLAYSVKQRTAEIGVRIAFGARTSTILGLIVGQGIRLSLLGVSLGLFGAWSLTRLMRSLLLDVSATDPLTYAGITALFLGVAVAASLIPALRAARVQPVSALRE